MSVVNEPVKQSAPQFSQKTGVKNAAVADKPIYITVIGQVAQPGVYEFHNQNPNLEQLISQHAGGLTPYSGHEFFVYREGQSLMQLDPRRHSLYQFEDNDILLAETPAKYYQSLGQGVSGPSLNDLHPLTQIVLLNVIDRPVLFSVKPEDARLVRLLEVLQQDASASVGVTRLEPLNVEHIPANAGIAPNRIISGSILRFDPRVIKRHTLPDLPQAIRVVTSDQVKVASNELTVPSIEHPTPHEETFSSEQSKPKKWSLPGVSMNDPIDLPGEQKKLEKGAQKDEKKIAKNTPFHESFHVFDELDSESLSGDTPIVAASDNKKKSSGSVLSTQQSTYFVSFLIIVTLFGTAWFIRHRQANRTQYRLMSAESRYRSFQSPSISNPVSTTSKSELEKEVEEEEIEEKAIVEDNNVEVEIETQAETDLKTSVVEEQVVVEEPVVAETPLESHDVVTPEIEEVKSEDTPEKPLQVTLEELLAETVEANESQQTVGSKAESNSTDADAVPQPLVVPLSIMDTPLMRELLKEQAAEYLKMASQSNEKEITPEKVEHPVTQEPFIEAKPVKAKKFRVDAAHSSAPQPLFPIVWQQDHDPKQEDAKINRYQTSDAAANEQATDRVDPAESSAVSGPHMKMQTPIQPRDDEEADLFDRVFRAVMRERQKNNQ